MPKNDLNFVKYWRNVGLKIFNNGYSQINTLFAQQRQEPSTAENLTVRIGWMKG